MTNFKGTHGIWYLQDYTDAYTHIIRCNDGKHETLYLASAYQSSDEKNRYNALLMSKSIQMLEVLTKISMALDDLWMVDDKNKVFDMINGLEIDDLIKSATELNETKAL